MVKAVVLTEFLTVEGIILDVRSPSEYQWAHIPGAINLPLFTDEERAVIGTLFKKQGQEVAVEEGLRLVGPKMLPLVRQAKQILGGAPAKVHCWRGGMRSSSVAWLLKTAGISTMVLQGGYKAFRQHVCQLWENIPKAKLRLLVLGGMTGSGKTVMLERLRQRGEQVLNLEEVAKHRGSSYGGVGLNEQPSHEQFENALALAWGALDLARQIWVEDESRMIGRCQIPANLFEGMKTAPLALIDRPVNERIRHLVEIYGAVPRQQLVEATQRLERRLGTQRTREAIQYIEQDHLMSAVEIILGYYDAAYGYGLKKQKRQFDVVRCDEASSKTTIEWLLQWGKNR